VLFLFVVDFLCENRAPPRLLFFGQDPVPCYNTIYQSNSLYQTYCTPCRTKNYRNSIIEIESRGRGYLRGNGGHGIAHSVFLGTVLVPGLHAIFANAGNKTRLLAVVLVLQRLASQQVTTVAGQSRELRTGTITLLCKNSRSACLHHRHAQHDLECFLDVYFWSVNSTWACNV